MANVRLLRQSLEDYNNRVAKIDSQYQSQYGQYTKDVEAYNADVLSHPNDPAYSQQVGKQQYIVGKQPDQMVQAIDPETGGLRTDIYGNPIMVNQVGANIYADSPTTLATPVAPVQGVAPPPPSFTNNDIRAMANPGTDPAGVVRDNNKGYSGNSEIAAMNDTPMRNSAFADPADPQGLKERGILARTLGGQL